MAIMDYVEQTWEEPKLFPCDPWERAQVIEICELINSGIQPLQNLGVSKRLKFHFHAKDTDVSQWNHFWISKGLEAVEKRVDSVAGRFSFGEKITAADAFIVPQAFSSMRFGVPIDDYPTLNRIYKNCMEISEFSKGGSRSATRYSRGMKGKWFKGKM